METPLQCKSCGGVHKDGKCQSCGSRIAIAKSQFEGDQPVRSRLTGKAHTIHFGVTENPGPKPESHAPEQE